MPISVIRNHPVASDEVNTLRAAAWNEAGEQDWTPILRRSLGWVCALEGSRLVGFVNVAWDGGVHAFLLDTTVHPEVQRMGVGTAIVLEAAAMAQARGAEWLHVDFDDELGPFYVACGFRPTSAGVIDLTDTLRVPGSG